MLVTYSMNNYCTWHNLETKNTGWSWDSGWLSCVCLWIHLPVYLSCNAMQCSAGCAVCCTELVILMPHSSLFLLSPYPPLCACAPLLPHLLYVCAQFPPFACAQHRTLCHRICTIRATRVLALCLHLSPTTMNSTWSWMATIKELNALGYLMRSSLTLMKWVNVISATNIVFSLCMWMWIWMCICMCFLYACYVLFVHCVCML